MAELPPILTSGSKFSSWLRCQRLRWLEYEAPNSAGGRGWERKALALPLSTGGWCHKIAQGLFLLALGRDMSPWTAELGLEAHPVPTEASGVVLGAKSGYLAEVSKRGLELGLQLDGAVPEEKFTRRTIAEQAALIEAFGWAFHRARLPRLLEEYELVDVEREEYTLLSGDVGLQSRCDAVLRRKVDQRLFVYNLKTSSSPDKRWKEQWEVDQQLMTETLAVERRLGEQVYGVVIDGFHKGARVEVWWDSLKEVRDGSGFDKGEKWQAQRSRLLYGYKCQDIPGRPVLYDFEGTTRKGWGKFAVWEEETFPYSFNSGEQVTSPIEYWLHWLPIEQLEACFITLPPIMRAQEHVEAKVRQIVRGEQRIRESRGTMSARLQLYGTANVFVALDEHYPQNEHSCTYPNKCPMYRLCWEPGASADPVSAGYIPRTDNHPEPEVE